MRRLTTYLCLLLSLPILARDWWPLPMDQGDQGRDSIEYKVELSAVASSGPFAPYWMHTNQYGRVSYAPYSGSMRMMVEKRATRPGRWWDYDFAVDISGMGYSNLPGNPKARQLRQFPYIQGKNGAFLVNRLYAHTRLYVVDVTAGILPIAPSNEEEDPELGTGDVLFSTNAPAMPRISIGIDRYTPVPGFFGYFELKGNITHTWVTDNIYVNKSFIHYKYAGARLGGKMPINITYEIHHAAQWGGYSPVFGDLGNSIKDLAKVFTARPGGTMFNDQLNALGNHISSQTWTLIGKGDGWRVSLAWQVLQEDDFRFIGTGRAQCDGRWSLRAEQSKWPYISSVCLEYLGTTDQSGPMHDQDGYTLNGEDNYYQNGIYVNGWNYNYFTLGTPFITSPLYNTGGEIYTLNNRAKVWYLGFKGDIFGFRYRVQGSHARNYHMYRGDGDIYTEKHRNMAWMVEVHKTVPQAWGLDFGLRVAGDVGTQFGNTGGVMISISKRGLVTSY